MIGLIVYKKRSIKNEEKEEEKSDVNPVYGTYEVHYDPVAEVGNTRIQNAKKIIFFQVEDENSYYGEV